LIYQLFFETIGSALIIWNSYNSTEYISVWYEYTEYQFVTLPVSKDPRFSRRCSYGLLETCVTNVSHTFWIYIQLCHELLKTFHAICSKKLIWFPAFAD